MMFDFKPLYILAFLSTLNAQNLVGSSCSGSTSVCFSTEGIDTRYNQCNGTAYIESRCGEGTFCYTSSPGLVYCGYYNGSNTTVVNIPSNSERSNANKISEKSSNLSQNLVKIDPNSAPTLGPEIATGSTNINNQDSQDKKAISYPPYVGNDNSDNAMFPTNDDYLLNSKIPTLSNNDSNNSAPTNKARTEKMNSQSETDTQQNHDSQINNNARQGPAEPVNADTQQNQDVQVDDDTPENQDNLVDGDTPDNLDLVINDSVLQDLELPINDNVAFRPNPTPTRRSARYRHTKPSTRTNDVDPTDGGGHLRPSRTTITTYLTKTLYDIRTTRAGYNNNRNNYHGKNQDRNPGRNRDRDPDRNRNRYQTRRSNQCNQRGRNCKNTTRVGHNTVGDNIDVGEVDDLNIDVDDADADNFELPLSDDNDTPLLVGNNLNDTADSNVTTDTDNQPRDALLGNDVSADAMITPSPLPNELDATVIQNFGVTDGFETTLGTDSEQNAVAVNELSLAGSQNGNVLAGRPIPGNRFYTRIYASRVITTVYYFNTVITTTSTKPVVPRTSTRTRRIIPARTRKTYEDWFEKYY